MRESNKPDSRGKTEIRYDRAVRVSRLHNQSDIRNIWYQYSMEPISTLYFLIQSINNQMV